MQCAAVDGASSEAVEGVAPPVLRGPAAIMASHAIHHQHGRFDMSRHPSSHASRHVAVPPPTQLQTQGRRRADLGGAQTWEHVRPGKAECGLKVVMVTAGRERGLGGVERRRDWDARCCGGLLLIEAAGRPCAAGATSRSSSVRLAMVVLEGPLDIPGLGTYVEHGPGAAAARVRCA
jgi:hypothetical protein